MSEILLVAMYCTFQNGMIANFNFFFLEIGRHVDAARLIFHTKPLSPAVKSVNYSTLRLLSHRNKIGDKFADPTTVTV